MKAMVGLHEPVFMAYGFFYYFNFHVGVTMAFAVVLSTPIVPALKKRFGHTTLWHVLSMLCIPALLVVCYSFILTSTYSPFLYAQF